MKTVMFLLCVLLLSCGSNSSSTDSTPRGTPIEPIFYSPFDSIKGECRHEALIASVIYEESGYQTRLMYGPSPDGTYHIQAQVLVDDEWYWIDVSNIFISLSPISENFEPEKEYTADEVYENCMGGVWY